MTGLLWSFSLLGSVAAASEGGVDSYERSVEMVREELARHPQSADLSLILAQVYTSASRFREALRIYKEGREAHPEDLRFLTGLGKTYLAQDELKLSIGALEQSLARARPGSPTRHVRVPLAEAFARGGEFARAIDQLRAATREGAPSPEILLQLGRVLDSESRRLRARGSAESRARSLAEEARKTLEEVIRLRPEHANAHYVLGRLLARLGEMDLAKKRLEDFRRLQDGEGRIDEAQIALTKASLEAGAAVDLAKVLSTLGETDRALGYTERALEVLPRFEPAMVARGSILLRAQRTGEATRAFEELLVAHPDHPTALMSLAQVAISHHDYGKAADYLLRAGRSGRAGRAWEALYRLAADGLALPHQREKFARAALQAHPSAENFANLAVTLFEAGRHAECEEVLRAGLSRFPDNQDLLLGLQVLRRSRKNER